MRALALALLLAAAPGTLWAGGPGVFDAGDLPEHHAEDPGAAAVTEASLVASERFWPYHVGLVRAWQPEGRAQPLPLGASGVLIRVEEGPTARIDFGRDGLHEVPVAATDLVERANRVRSGALDKMAANYVLAIGSRLIDAAADPPRPHPFRDVTEQRALLSVFADPRAPGFGELARALAPLHERPGLLTILFPQGERPDPEVWARLRALDWPVAFVHDHLAEVYTHSLLPVGLAPPALLLQSPEGGVRFQGAARPEVVAELEAAVERAFPTATAAAPR